MIITIDGPAGSGKTTVAKIIARKLNIAYLDTGAMYRAVGLILGDIVDKISQDEIKDILKGLDFDLIMDGEKYVLRLNNKILGNEIRSEKVAFMASKVGKIPCVREYLKKSQREIGKKYSLVAEGRDMGTVVFKDADFKFFLTASCEIRAKRRVEQLREMGIKADYIEILEDIKKRDAQDSTRKIAPLKPAKDAHIIDTSNLTIDDVVDKIAEVVQSGV